MNKINKPNILFIMADQLRYDYLGCTGHPHIKTPNIDSLAENGVKFSHVFCQSPICGPSRMCFYTGRYAASHGSTFNDVPLSIGEKTIGDYLRPQGYRVALSGKTHMKADTEGMQRLGIDAGSPAGVLASQCGFEPFWRDDGLYPTYSNDPNSVYNSFLRSKGYESENPWHDFANSAEGDNGEVLSGWEMKNVHLPARIDKSHSETAFTTDKAIEFMEDAKAKSQTWCLHASYIKPHWPYIAPAPYNDMYDKSHVIPANRSDDEKANANPVYDAYMQNMGAVNFSRHEVRERVIPVYMGLITEFDDHVGRIVNYLKRTSQFDNTIIVITADHGDYLGDHWLSDKSMFHDESVRIPLIIHDPRKTADSSRGKTCHELIEAIDLCPTFYEWAGGDANDQDHVLEGASLVNFIDNNTVDHWRGVAISENDFAQQPPRSRLGITIHDARGYMVREHTWKMVYYEGFPCQLFDLKNDPNELNDLGQNPEYRDEITRLENILFAWLRNRKNRKTITSKKILSNVGTALKKGYWNGVWDRKEIEHLL